MVGYSMNLMRHPKFLALKNESFDLLIVGWCLNEYVLGLSAHFYCPSIVISPNVNFYPIRKFSGNPSSASTIPSVLMAIDSDMTFFDRIVNFLAYVVEFVMFEIIFHFYAMPYYIEEFPPDKYPAYEEVLRNVSLVLVAQHFSGQVSEALLPNVIEIEGMHVKNEPSPLPMVLWSLKSIEIFTRSLNLVRRRLKNFWIVPPMEQYTSASVPMLKVQIYHKKKLRFFSINSRVSSKKYYGNSRQNCITCLTMLRLENGCRKTTFFLIQTLSYSFLIVERAESLKLSTMGYQFFRFQYLAINSVTLVTLVGCVLYFSFVLYMLRKSTYLNR